MRRMINRSIALLAILSLTGCLATIVNSPKRGGQIVHQTTGVHIIALPIVLNAPTCREGLANVRSWVPLWGLAVGILTIGILVPVTTAYTCVEG